MILSVVNQKGGTGKTTTALHLSYLLAEEGCEVLAVDLDPQAALSFALGVDGESLDLAVDSVLESYAFRRGQRVGLDDVVKSVAVGEAEFELAPSRLSLDALNVSLAGVVGREKVLSRVLAEARERDVVVVDCQPAISMLTINALVASDYVLIPVETAYLPLRGLLHLLDVIDEVRSEFNGELRVLGILPTKYDSRLETSRDNLEKLRRFEKVCNVYPPVPYSAYFEKSLRDRVPLREFDFKTARVALRALEVVRDDVLKLVGR